MKPSRTATALALTAILGLSGLAAGFGSSFATSPNAESASDEATQTELTFAVVPQQSASRLAREWGPLIAALSERTGLGIRFVTTKDIPTFEACLNDGVFDIAYMNPYHYVVFSGDGQYRALAHQADRRLKGLVVVRAESEVTDIAELEDSLVVFPSPGAFGASILPRAELKSRGIAVQTRYVRSHDSVYRAVAGGFAKAGGGVTRTLAAAPAELRDQLRVVYTTDGYTPHAIAARTSLSENVTDRLRGALTGIAEDDPDATRDLNISAFVAADDGAWNDVRALGLTPAQAGLDRLNEVACPFD